MANNNILKNNFNRNRDLNSWNLKLIKKQNLKKLETIKQR